MEALISVIVPVYNVKKYLQQCVESIIVQSYKQLEILLVDDGSSDGSSELCDRLKSIDKRIQVYHKGNGGLSDARNFGIEHSSGDYLAFIDSDDALHKDFFFVLMEAQEKYNADIVGCGMTLYHDLAELPELFKINHKYTERVFTSEDALKEYFSPSGDRIIHHGLCMKIYKRELFSQIRFDIGKLHEDLYITYRLLDSAKAVVYVDSPYYFYFQNNSDSICKNYGIKNFLDEAEAYNRIYKYFEEQDRVTEELIHFLIIQYLLMFEKGYDIRRSKDIQSADDRARKWVRDHVKECSYFGTVKKALILASLKDIRIYSILKKARGQLGR